MLYERYLRSLHKHRDRDRLASRIRDILSRKYPLRGDFLEKDPHAPPRTRLRVKPQGGGNLLGCASASAASRIISSIS